MKNPTFGIAYILLVIVQMVICNYFQFSPYFVISILPAMVLCIPLTISTNLCMLLAFITGLSVDWLAEGLIGINASALIPVAYARKTLIRVFLGEDLICCAAGIDARSALTHKEENVVLFFARDAFGGNVIGMTLDVCQKYADAVFLFQLCRIFIELL